jgi:hypothetical protein
MASTRNKNTQGNYNLEQRNHTLSASYKLYANSSHGSAYQTQNPGNGLNPGQIPGNKLSHNTADIESFLFGIGSTNLVTPSASHNPRPELVQLSSIHIFDKQTTAMPIPLYLDKNQRPMFS